MQEWNNCRDDITESEIVASKTDQSLENCAEINCKFAPRKETLFVSLSGQTPRRQDLNHKTELNKLNLI